MLVRLDVDNKLSEGLKTVHLRTREEDKWAVLLHLLDQVNYNKAVRLRVFQKLFALDPDEAPNTLSTLPYICLPYIY